MVLVPKLCHATCCHLQPLALHVPEPHSPPHLHLNTDSKTVASGVCQLVCLVCMLSLSQQASPRLPSRSISCGETQQILQTKDRCPTASTVDFLH